MARLVIVSITLLLSIAGVARSDESPKKESTVPPLPAIELPPKPEDPAGLPLAREAREKLLAGEAAAALALYRQAYEKGLRRVDSAYNAACAASLSGEVDEAFVWLERSADQGWHDPAHLETDTDLDPLRDDPRFAAFRERFRANAEAYDKEHNAELRAMYEADQAARQDISRDAPEEEREAFWAKLMAEDEARRERAAEIAAGGGIKTGEDYFAAAMIYQHGESLDDFAKAREYAAKAVELGNERGRWLAAAAWDRWLVNAGYHQRFGTQYMCDPKCRLEPWDETITDEERARWNVPPIEEALRMADDF